MSKIALLEHCSIETTKTKLLGQPSTKKSAWLKEDPGADGWFLALTGQYLLREKRLF